jgi:hypothetical protein
MILLAKMPHIYNPTIFLIICLLGYYLWWPKVELTNCDAAAAAAAAAVVASAVVSAVAH